MTAQEKEPKENNLIATNRKAFHDYHIMENYEAGIELKGTEVKSCRAKAVTLTDSYVKIESGEAIMMNVHIAEYEHGNRFNHDAKRPRRLLLHKREILKIASKIKERGLTVIPLRFYLKKGRVKVDLGIAKGKNVADKRDTMRKKQDELETRRAISAYK